jgi:predicted DNA-binding transcriptional regulator AlpA
MPPRPQEQTPKHERKLATRASRAVPEPSATTNRHERHGDRGDAGDADDDADDARLPAYCRFRDLQAAGIATNWPMLLRLITDQGFPAGIWLGANTHVWEISAVRAWLATRPSMRKSLLGRSPSKQKEELAA